MRIGNCIHSIFGRGLMGALALGMLTSQALAGSRFDHKKIGVLIGSYGDVDDPSEARGLAVNTLEDPDVVPLPGFLRTIIARLGWEMKKNSILEEYAAIGNQTGLRANTTLQAEGVAQRLRAMGLDAHAYTGFTQISPSVEDALRQAQADGMEALVVFYQGAQYSRATSYLVFRDTRQYLAKHPEWKVEAVAVRSFSNDQRFRDLMVDNIQGRIEESFPGVPPEDVCVFLPMHGNITIWIERGDPFLDQALNLLNYLREAFPRSYVSHGFQNHSELPVVKWTEPEWDSAADELVQQPCSKVLINGQATFTVDSLETLYDHDIMIRNYIMEKARERGRDVEVVNDKMLNAQPAFLDLLAALAREALEFKGDIWWLNR